MGESTSARGPDVSERQASQKRCPHQGAGGRKPETERSAGVPDPGTNAVKKSDELGLTNRRKGATYSGTQQARISNRVAQVKASGVTKIKALRTLGVCRSSYYGWQKRHHDPPRKPSIRCLTAAERAVIIEQKKANPQLSHRQISGDLRCDGFRVSPSSCYRMLKALGWVEPRLCREAPWETAR